MLHWVSRLDALKVLPERIASEDGILLVGEAITALYIGHEYNVFLDLILAKAARVCVINDQCAAQGLSSEQVCSGVDLIDCRNLVQLTEQYQSILLWN